MCWHFAPRPPRPLPSTCPSMAAPRRAPRHAPEGCCPYTSVSVLRRVEAANSGARQAQGHNHNVSAEGSSGLDLVRIQAVWTLYVSPCQHHFIRGSRLWPDPGQAGSQVRRGSCPSKLIVYACSYRDGGEVFSQYLDWAEGESGNAPRAPRARLSLNKVYPARAVCVARTRV